MLDSFCYLGISNNGAKRLIAVRYGDGIYYPLAESNGAYTLLGLSIADVDDQQICSEINENLPHIFVDSYESLPDGLTQNDVLIVDAISSCTWDPDDQAGIGALRVLGTDGNWVIDITPGTSSEVLYAPTTTWY